MTTLLFCACVRVQVFILLCVAIYTLAAVTTTEVKRGKEKRHDDYHHTSRLNENFRH